jgi:hypothetical protein
MENAIWVLLALHVAQIAGIVLIIYDNLKKNGKWHDE